MDQRQRSPGLPRGAVIGPRASKLGPGPDGSGSCVVADTELNRLVMTAGEALKVNASDPEYTKERTYRTVDLEAFYFNDTGSPANNCDTDGPVIGAGPFAGGAYHQVNDLDVAWSIPVTDVSGVWRVVVVVTDHVLDGQGGGTWEPVELSFDAGSGRWKGTKTVARVAVSG